MTKQELIEYGEQLGSKYHKYDSSLGYVAYMDAFTAAVELLWPLVSASPLRESPTSDKALEDLKQKLEKR